MIIAHLADLHLGYRAYSRLTPEGRNQREVDVANAFARTVDAVGALHPDLVLIAGDVFHSVRPSNAAIAEAFRGLSWLAEHLPGAPIVVIAGDRDTPRSADTTSILELFREIGGVSVVTGGLETLRFPGIDAQVTAVPHAEVAGVRAPRIPAPIGAAVRVLVAHGRLSGASGLALPGADAHTGGAPLPPSLLKPDEWTYVALGDHPVATRLAPNAWYSGSIEHTSPDPWAEAKGGQGKGFIAYDTEAGEASFHPIETRRVMELPRLSAGGLDAAGLAAAIEARLAEFEDELQGSIVRMVVTDVSPAEMRRLDGSVLRAARARALHFVLEARPPDRVTAESMVLAARGVSLEAQVERYLAEAWEPTMEGIDPPVLARLARRYLERAARGGSGSS